MTKEEKLMQKEAEKAKRKARKEHLKTLTKEEKKAFLQAEREEKLEQFRLSEIEHDKMVEEKRQSLLDDEKSTFWLDFSQYAIWQFFRRWWNKFSHLHPVAAKWIYEIFFFLVFSNGVTIWQFLVMLFLPYAFQGLKAVEFVWPAVNYTWFDGAQLTWAIFNEPVKTATDGSILVAGGLGNFLAFEIAVFTAQVINFPLQRNITFKSHGNPWWQAMWYFIGWVLISLAVNALWGFVGPVAEHYFVDVWHWGNAESVKPITDLIKTVITGGISMVIFFFIFKIIFPSENKETVNA